MRWRRGRGEKKEEDEMEEEEGKRREGISAKKCSCKRARNMAESKTLFQSGVCLC